MSINHCRRRRRVVAPALSGLHWKNRQTRVRTLNVAAPSDRRVSGTRPGCDAVKHVYLAVMSVGRTQKKIFRGLLTAAQRAFTPRLEAMSRCAIVCERAESLFVEDRAVPADSCLCDAHMFVGGGADRRTHRCITDARAHLCAVRAWRGACGYLRNHLAPHAVRA